jgi:hypothetical protein
VLSDAFRGLLYSPDLQDWQLGFSVRVGDLIVNRLLCCFQKVLFVSFGFQPFCLSSCRIGWGLKSFF